MAEPLLVTRGLSRSYGDLTVLRDVDLALAAGEAVAIVGPSGCGKSTLLNIIGGLLAPSSGDVLFDGRSVAGKSADDLAKYRNEDVGFVFQSHHLLPQCTALENVMVPTLAGGGAGAEVEQRATSLLESVGLAERASHRPAQLSGGECQRVAAVRALINQPRLLLADEPTGSLDGKAAEQMGELLRELNRSQGVALLAVTHSERLAARMDRVLRLEDGQLRSQ